MSNKEKGANAERELLHKFVDEGYMCVRIAGSGLLPEPSCDLIVGKFNKKFAIECKSVKGHIKYLDKDQIERFIIFSEIFGLVPVLAVRFNRQGWYFFDKEDIKKTQTGLAVSIELAQEKGKRFGEVF